MAISLHSVAQDFTFKIRKVPTLKYFVFADGFNTHNLDVKTKVEEEFPLRMYLQVYDNDTFLVRWSNWKLSEANVQLDYLKRDSLTYASKLIRQGDKGMKFEFPFQGETYQMFTMSEEPLVKQQEYKVGPLDKPIKMIKFFFLYNKKLVILADIEKEKVENDSTIEEAIKLSARIKLGFYSSNLYSSKKVSADIPLNIVYTYPVNFILNNSNTCDRKLYWKGLRTNMQLNLSDTSEYRKQRNMISKMPDDVLIDMNGESVEYYKSRRYVYMENDSQIYVSSLNRGCDVFRDTLSNLDSIPIANVWDARDGINNYLVDLGDNRWGWASRYSCAVEWRVYDEKKIKKSLKLTPKKLFKGLIFIEPAAKVLLNQECEK